MFINKQKIKTSHVFLLFISSNFLIFPGKLCEAGFWCPGDKDPVQCPPGTYNPYPKVMLWFLSSIAHQSRIQCPVLLVYKLVCRSIWMDIIEKCPEIFSYVEQFVLAATPFFAYRNLLFQLLKVVHTPIWGLNDQSHRVSGYASHS